MLSPQWPDNDNHNNEQQNTHSTTVSEGSRLLLVHGGAAGLPYDARQVQPGAGGVRRQARRRTGQVDGHHHRGRPALRGLRQVPRGTGGRPTLVTVRSVRLLAAQHSQALHAEHSALLQRQWRPRAGLYQHQAEVRLNGK